VVILVEDARGILLIVKKISRLMAFRNLKQQHKCQKNMKKCLGQKALASNHNHEILKVGELSSKKGDKGGWCGV